MSAEERAAWFRESYGRALRSLERGDAQAAEQQLREIQRAWPGEVNSQRVLGLALLAQGRAADAVSALQAAVAAAPDFFHALVDLGRAHRAQGRFDAAIDCLRKALILDAGASSVWRMLADLLVNTGEFASAYRAYAQSIATDPYGKVLEQAGKLLNAGDRKQSEILFRQVLQKDSNQVGALCGLAAISLAAGFPQDSERLLRHALKQSAHMPLIRRGLAQTLLETAHYEMAEAEIRHALLIEDDAPSSWIILGTILAHTMRQDAALAAYERALALNPQQIRVMLAKGHVLKTLGARAQCEAIYKQCIAVQPDFAEAYYSLADLKNYAFSDAEIASMDRLLRRTAHSNPGGGSAAAGEDAAGLAQLHFALGRAREQRGMFAEAFKQYAAGNAARRRGAPFDAAGFDQDCRRLIVTFDAPFLASRTGVGCEDGAPIFIVGLPRSGSTLVEQVLASHSAVEGTMELPNVGVFVRELDEQGGRRDAYPECLTGMTPEQFRALGERYLAETQIFRSGRRFFLDKMPNNFGHVGLIHLMLPKAKIIDVRRHPMDACFSAFKQYFAKGQTFTYDLEDLGRYYRSYLKVMDHWNTVLPGRVLCVRYEDLVRDTEAQVRRLLAHCGLDFEAACLRFYETKRAVRTASSEQVRVPIYDSSIGYWRRFESQLAPLRQSLGASLDRFADL
jgi:tetratricopeptide (TPR) repeat protein